MRATDRRLSIPLAALLAAGISATVFQPAGAGAAPPTPAEAAGEPLAVVDGEAITLEDLKRDFERRHQGHRMLLGEAPVVEDFLEALIRRRLLVHEGRRIGLHREADIRERAEAAAERRRSEWLYESEVTAKTAVTGDQVAAAIEAMKTARDVVLVQADTPEKARQASGELREGSPPELVARRLSAARSRTAGGLERVFWGEREPALERAIFEAEEGEIVGPIATDRGWVVAKILRSVTADAAAHNSPEERARGVLRRRHEAARRAEFLDGLRARYEARLHGSLLDPALVVPLLGAEGETRAVPEASRAGDPVDPVLAEWRGGRIMLSEFARGIRADAFLPLSPGQQRLQMSQLLSDRLDRELLRLESRRREAAMPAALRAQIQADEDDLVHRALLERVVFRDLSVSDAEIEKRHRSQPEAYVEPPRVLLSVALLPDEPASRAFLEAVRGGEDFQALARRRSTDRTFGTAGGQPAWVSREAAIPELRETVFDLEPGALAGPIGMEDGWLVVRVVDRNEGRRKSLPEVREQIRSELFSERSVETIRRWEGRLREVAEIRVNPEAVRRAVRVLGEESRARLRVGASAAHGSEGGASGASAPAASGRDPRKRDGAGHAGGGGREDRP